jgi:hypothetical protein
MDMGYFSSASASQGTLSVGDSVTVTTPVIYGTDKRFKLYYDRYTVMEIKGDRVVIGVDGVVTAAVAAGNLKRFDGTGTAAASQGTLSVGDFVTVTTPMIYGTDKRFKLYYDRYTVMEIKGDRVVIGVDGVVTAAVAAGNLKKV